MPPHQPHKLEKNVRKRGSMPIIVLNEQNFGTYKQNKSNQRLLEKSRMTKSVGSAQ
jgi:hypothetical protein